MPIRGSESVLFEATDRTAIVVVSRVPAGLQAHSRWLMCVCEIQLSPTKDDLREASAKSSFFFLILSLRPSASRRAAAIFACICSPDISADMVVSVRDW